ncbi:ribosome recycling factor [Selenihalanaerobacter shriftii]|uniref:Ribosome-recycling factor n=1 Tax=Selenihalanaerobacter shriftii TaxID=142842 RepID=A0A1T4MDC3_9FIRM|nr:ribosome recycling factor [Selenihalanaerobacter shriftii]SJZ64881.1 ribosome recycling factor [Selenihalanaerobacter shriftii]
MIQQVLNKTRKKMDQVIDATKKDFATIRTGRAKPSLVEGITVDYYGTQTPINQMAKVSAPEPRQLLVRPWDTNSLEQIEKAILKSDLGLTPNNDGEVIRINIPQLTEERRKEFVQLAKTKSEDKRIVIRDIRREANDELEELESNGDISEDNYHRGLDNIQDLTDEYINKIDELLAKKESDILEI